MDIETTLHKSYQETTWGVREAMREIISNALDGETRHAELGQGQMSLTYEERTRTVAVRNKGVTVPTKALLMGTSESRGDDRTIGQFGEGLPMALLVLARESYGVEIDNGAERWTPSIERSGTFSGEPVLVVKTRKLRVDREAFEVRVCGISPDLWAEVKLLFLKLDPDLDDSMVLAERPGASISPSILLQSRYIGRVYNKGVFVTKRDDLLFGYDLTSDLNRDRSMIDEYTLKDRLAKLLSTVVATHIDRFSSLLVSAMLESENALELRDSYSDLYYNNAVKTNVTESFVRKHGPDAIPVDSEDEADRARKLGRRPVRTRGVLTTILQETLGSVSAMESKTSREVMRTWEMSELTGPERYHLEVARVLLRSVEPNANLTVQVVTFQGEKEATVLDSGDKKILIAKRELLKFEELFLHLAKATGRCLGKYNGEAEILAKAVVKLFSGDANLALNLIAREGIR
jgi:hypothetical protein